MNDLDRDFAQFARTGDPAALARVYDASAAELLALAARLVGDPVEAEDVVQATFLAAIESARTFAPGRRAMPWLVGILTNRVRRLRRARRASAPTQVPAASDGADESSTAREPFERLHDVELQGRLARALDRLSPVLRPVLELRLQRGMSPAEIACALRRPPATVRSQLARGLEQVRNHLPQRTALPAVLAAAPTRGLDALRADVLAHAAAHAGAPATTATATAITATTAKTTTAMATSAMSAATVIGGAMLMAKQGKLAVAAAAVLILGALAWWQIPPRAPAAGPGAADGDAPAVVVADPRSETSTAASTPEREPATHREAVAATATATALRVRVHTGERPIPGAIVVVRPAGDFLGPRLRAVTGADGVAPFDARIGSEGIFHLLGTTRIGGRYRIAPGTTATESIEVPPPCLVRGVVATEVGAPGDATVWLGGAPGDDGVFDVFAPRADGSFELALWSETLVGARGAGTIPVHHTVAQQPGATVDLVLHLRAGGASLRGRVVDDDARTVAGARVEIGDRFGWYEGRLLPDGSRESVLPFTVVADDDGRFVVDGLLPGMVGVSAAADGFAPATAQVELPRGGAGEVLLTLGAGCRIHGRVTRADGQPAANATVRSGDEGRFATVATRTDGAGRYRLTDVRAGEVTLHAAMPGHGRILAQRRLEPGDDVEWDLALDARHDRIDGRLVDAHGRPLADWWVVAHGDPRDAGAPVQVGADGSFELGPFPFARQRYDLRVHPRGERGGDGRPVTQAVHAVAGVAAGTHGLEIAVPDAAMPTAWLRGRFVRVGKGYTPLLRGESGTTRALRSGGDGTFEFGPLPAGRWRIVLPTYPRELELAAVDLLAGDNRDLGEVQVPAVVRGTAELELPRLDLLPGFRPEFESAAAVQVLLADDLSFVRWANVDVGTTPLSLLPGRYVVRLAGVPLAPVAHEFEVTAGATTRVPLTVRPAGMRRIAFRHPGAAHPSERLELTVRDAAGRTVWNGTMTPRDGWWFWELNLEPGTYALDARTPSGLACAAALQVDAADAGLRPIVFALTGAR